MSKRKAQFKCAKCGAVHVFSETDEGFDVELVKSDDPDMKPKPKSKPDFFDWLVGGSKDDSEEDK